MKLKRLRNSFSEDGPAAPLSKEEFAYRTLRESILSGELKQGQTLVQTEIASQLGVSAIPVRAAVGRLIAEGLVTQKTHHAPRVASISSEQLAEILFVRMHLETLATQRAVPFITPDVLETLEELVRLMDEKLAESNMPAFGALNKRFHLIIYECCPHPLLLKLIHDLWDNSDRFRSRTMFGVVPGLAERSQQDHKELLKLLAAGDGDGAAKLMEHHKSRSRQEFLKKLENTS